MLAAPAWAATLYVDGANATCSDARSYAMAQSDATPLCGPAAAAAMVLPGDMVKLKAATYVLTSTLRLSRSGASGQPITFEPFGDGPVVLSGPHADAGNTGSGVYITGSYQVLQGLELTGSQAEAVYVSGGTVTVRSLRIHDCDDDGVRVGTGAADVLVESTVSFANGSGTSGHCFSATGTRIVLRNNVGVACPANIFDIWPACQACDVYNNLAYGSPSAAGFELGGQDGGTGFGTTARLYNNIALGNAGHGFLLYQSIDAVLSNNLAFGNQSSFHVSGGASYTEVVPTVTADPMLSDVAALDWHLQPGSPAIDTGSSLLAPPTDLDGDPRPFGAGMDIGPDEYIDASRGDAGSLDAGSADEGAPDAGASNGRHAGLVANVGCGCASTPSFVLSMLALLLGLNGTGRCRGPRTPPRRRA